MSASSDQVTVGTSRVQLMGSGTNIGRTDLGVLVKAAVGNAGTVYVGGSDVTTSNGLELTAGESVVLPVNDNVGGVAKTDYYAVASQASQSVSIIAV